jgi:hypothetical protein
MPRLHIITGTNKTGKSNAAWEKQRAEPAADWLIADGSDSQTVSSFVNSERNVIWVVRTDEPFEVTQQHQVPLPTTFGSSIIAVTIENRVRRRLVKTYTKKSEQVQGIFWADEGGGIYLDKDIIDARVLYVAEEV